jgi:hypothetical protein
MKNIGILLNNLGPSQLAYYLIKNGNDFVEDGDNDLVAFFYEVSPECIRPNFASMNLSEAYSYNGILVATDANSASRILEFPGSTHKFFYVWDLEWAKIQNKQFEDLATVYHNDRLPLIARSKTHFDIIKKIWKEPIGIVEDVDIRQLHKITSEYINGRHS